MKKLNLIVRKSSSEAFLLVGMLLLAVSLPIATRLVQQNQENRSQASEICTSFTYEPWSVCTNGKQTRAVKTKYPAGCAGGSPKTSQTCGTVTCTSFTYNDWSACVNGKQTRTVKTASPYGCTGGTKDTSRACNITCVYTCTAWSTCKSDSSSTSGGTQSCTAESKTPSTCTGGTKKVGSTRNCTPTASTATCVYTCTAWGTCSSGKQVCLSESKSPSNCTGGSKKVGSTRDCTSPEKTCSYNGATYAIGKAICQGDKPAECLSTGTWKIFSSCPNGCSGQGVCNSNSTCTYANRDITKCSGKDILKCVSTYVPSSMNYVNEWTRVETCSSGCNQVTTTKAECQGSGQPVVNGICGTADGQKYTSAPTSSTALCSSGTPTSVSTGTSNYTWSCNGNSLGKSVSCSAVKVTVTPTKSGGSSPGTPPGSPPEAIPTTCVNTVTVNPNVLTLKVGETSTVKATNSCTGTSTGITWSSDDGKIATVNANGLVTAVAVGSTATITAKSTDGKTATVSVIVVATETKTLSFKFVFSGIKPDYTNLNGDKYNCLGSLDLLNIEITNKPKNVSEHFTDVHFSVLGNEVNNNGNQVFQVTNLLMGDSLSSVDTYNYLKVKGPFHLKRRLCLDGQDSKLDETTVCEIDLAKTDGYVYDFTEYEFLAGDVDLNGIVNGIDFVTVKNSVNTGAEPVCGILNDLNMDGVVNGIDLSLIRDISLAQVDDE